MGWSIDIVRPELNKIFKEAERKYRILRAQSYQQGVVIEHLGDKDLAGRFKIRIAELFPDFVYVAFILVQESQEVAEQQRWDN